jgi:lipopolysaccharide biosynthesis regulator YciM
LQDTQHRAAALESLLEIYVQEKEWPKAIETAKRLALGVNRPYQKEIAQFDCELALTESAQNRLETARGYLGEALRENRECVRANELLGDIEMQQGHVEAALQAWKRIETQNPAYLALVIGRIVAAYRQLERTDEALAVARDYLNRYPALEILDAAYHLVLEREGPHAAYPLVRDSLRRSPSLQGLDALLEAQLMVAPIEQRPDLQGVKNLVHAYAARLAYYRCDSCGFRARTFHWRCPACGGWETFPPRRSEEDAERDRSGSNFNPG